VIDIEVVLKVLAPSVIVFVLALLVGVGVLVVGVEVLPPQAASTERARANRAIRATFFTENHTLSMRI
jgi:hypothetical protein